MSSGIGKLLKLSALWLSHCRASLGGSAGIRSRRGRHDAWVDGKWLKEKKGNEGCWLNFQLTERFPFSGVSVRFQQNIRFSWKKWTFLAKRKPFSRKNESHNFARKFVPTLSHQIWLTTQARTADALNEEGAGFDWDLFQRGPHIKKGI